MAGKDDLIIDMLKNLREEQRDHRKEMNDHQKNAVKWQASCDNRLSNLEDDMKEHVEGVVQNRTKNIEQDVRLNKLEEPKKIRDIIKGKVWKLVLGIGTLIGIAYTAMKVFETIQ